MPTISPNIYLVVLAALGWAVSLYFGFFRYRQYVWSRNKVRYDLLLKLDQRRSDLAARVLMVGELRTEARPRKARLAALHRRYVSVIQLIDFYRGQGVLDDAILEHLRSAVSADLRHMLAPEDGPANRTREWLADNSAPGNFISALTFE